MTKIKRLATSMLLVAVLILSAASSFWVSPHMVTASTEYEEPADGTNPPENDIPNDFELPPVKYPVR